MILRALLEQILNQPCIISTASQLNARVIAYAPHLARRPPPHTSLVLIQRGVMYENITVSFRCHTHLTSLQYTSDAYQTHI